MAFATLLVPIVGLTAIASIVSDAATLIGVEYVFDPALGATPSVV